MSRVLPILFNTEMVQAILDGRKTVTRRICKDANDYVVPDMSFYDVERSRCMKDLHDLYTIRYAEETDPNYGRCETCKHYGNGNYCSYCIEGSEYKFDLVYYQKMHDTEIAEWIKKNQ